VSDAVRRYEDAQSRRDMIYEQWIGDGAPLLAMGSTGQLVEHPLVRMIRDHDALLVKLEVAVRQKRTSEPGRKPTAVLQVSSPAADLRRAS
jgi:hypothetical protein